MKVRHIIPISGKDSLATAIVTKLWFPDKELEYFFNDTRKELPEVYEWLTRVEGYLGKPIVRVGADLDEIIRKTGFLPSDRMRYCTRLAKIEPMERYIGREDMAFVYFGIRADEINRVGYRPIGKAKIQAVYPLQLLDLKLEDVWRVCQSVDLLPPSFFWQEIWDRVTAIVPMELINQLTPWEKQMLFSWRSRPNCRDCFYQRQYEFIGLYIHYPELFEEMCHMEETVGGEGYTIRESYRMRDLPMRAQEIIDRRVDWVASWIFNRFGWKQQGPKKARRNQATMWGNDKLMDSLLSSSCGLFCGK
jgi:hypothetical protein